MVVLGWVINKGRNAWQVWSFCQQSSYGVWWSTSQTWRILKIFLAFCCYVSWILSGCQSHQLWAISYSAKFFNVETVRFMMSLYYCKRDLYPLFNAFGVRSVFFGTSVNVCVICFPVVVNCYAMCMFYTELQLLPGDFYICNKKLSYRRETVLHPV